MMSKNWGYYSFTVTIFVLTGAVALLALGCTTAVTSNVQTQATTSPSINPSSRTVPVSQDQPTASLAPQIETLQANTSNTTELPFVGTRYFNFLGGSGTGETIAIAADGTTTITLHGTASSSVEYQGKFTNPILLEDGRGLLIKGDKIYSLLPDGQIAQGCMGEGKPCESTLQEVASAPPDDGFDNDDDRFKQQYFSQPLFEQVHQINKECGFYDVTSPCSVRIYAFKDASLITQRNGTESVKYTLTLYQAVSQQQALAYAKILNNGNNINLTNFERQSDKIIYRGCPYDAGAQEPANLCVTELYLASDGKISGVTLTNISP